MKKNNLLRKGVKAFGLAACSLLISNIASAQFSESFDNQTMPAGWSVTNTNPSPWGAAAQDWRFSGTPDYAMSGTADHTGNGGHYAWVDGSSPYPSVLSLTSPTIPMSGYTNPELRFWFKSDIGTYTGHNDFFVDVFDGAVWHDSLYHHVGNTVNDDWEQVGVALGGLTFTGPAQIRFNVSKSGLPYPYNNDITLDDIEIVSVLDNDAGLANMITPVLPGCSVDSVVTVEIQNFGSLNLTSATVNWSINGVLQAPVSWTGNLATNAMDSVVVGTNNNIAFGDVIAVWTSMPNGIVDSAAVNDSVILDYIQGYSGVTLIDPNGGGDFVSFTDAMNKLEIYGMCGNLVIEAVDTVYVEQFMIPEIAGLSGSNSITFRSQSGIRENVVLTYTATGSADNYVARVFGVDNISFEDMTIWNQGASYATCVNGYDAENISIDNCVIKSHNGTSSNGRAIYFQDWFQGTSATFNNISVSNSQIEGGYYGVYLYNYPSARGNGVYIENNKFINQYLYGAYTTYSDNVHINGNYVNSSATPSTWSTTYGIYVNNAKLGEVKNNYVEGTPTWPRYGVRTNNVNGDLSQYFVFANNRVYLPGANADYGFYFSNSLFTHVVSNSVYVDGDAGSNAMYFPSGQYNFVYNNNLQIANGGTGLAFAGNAIYESDYNNLSSPMGDVAFDGTFYQTLSDWQNATQLDSNSITVNILYSDTMSLAVCTDSIFEAGIIYGGITEDFQGEPRNAVPCIGADEFVPVSMFGFDENPVLCDGDTLTIVQNYFDTVVWNGVDTSSTFVATSSQLVTVSVSDVCGSAADTFSIVGQDYATLFDMHICADSFGMVHAGISNGTYLWNTGSTDSVITVDMPQTISVEVMDEHGCYSVDSAVVTQSVAASLMDTTNLCEGQSVTLDPQTNGVFVWSDSSTGSDLSVSTPGNYCVTVTDLACVSTACTEVIEILEPQVSFADSSDWFTVVFTNNTTNTDENTSYHWDFGDGNTSTEKDPIHLYGWSNDSVNEVKVTLTVTTECGVYDFEHVVRYGNAVSVNEISLADMVNVFPNPSNGVFNVAVNSSTNSDVEVVVVDARGAQVYSQNLGRVNGSINKQINLTNASSGIYFVKVMVDSEVAIYKLSVN